MTHAAKIFTATILLGLSYSTHTLGQQAYASTTAPAYTNTVSAEEANIIKTAFASNPEAEASFMALFPNASIQQWSTTPGNSWVSFVNNGRKANASFSPKGKLNYIITDCAMEQLPVDFSKAIKNSYAGYNLFSAIEIKAYGAVAYQVVLENNKGFTTLKYTSEGVEETQQVKKR